MRIFKLLLTVLKQRLLRLYYGKNYHALFYSAEKNVINKVHDIDKLFSKSARRKIFKEGFNSDKLLWYDFNRFRKEDYISDYEHYTLTEKIDWHQYYVANDKLVCERMLSPFCNVVPTIGYIYRGEYYPIGSNGISFERLVESIDKGEDFYAKPNGGGSGKGVGRISFKKGVYYWNDEIIDDVRTFIRSLSKNEEAYLIQRKFCQSGFSHDVNPDTLNTVRVVTMLSPETHEPFLAYACHRFGRKGSYVDNIAKANILCPIDINTGIIMDCIVPPVEGKLIHLEKHPDSGVKIKGIKLPQWEGVVDLCFKLAKELPFMPLCGWDIIVSDDALYMQELNYNPDIYLGQVLYPLLLDKKVKKFIDYYRLQK